MLTGVRDSVLAAGQSWMTQRDPKALETFQNDLRTFLD